MPRTQEGIGETGSVFWDLGKKRRYHLYVFNRFLGQKSTMLFCLVLPSWQQSFDWWSDKIIEHECAVDKLQMMSVSAAKRENMRTYQSKAGDLKPFERLPPQPKRDNPDKQCPTGVDDRAGRRRYASRHR